MRMEEGEKYAMDLQILAFLFPTTSKESIVVL